MTDTLGRVHRGLLESDGDMEENLIGAMLLSREAIQTALTIVTETDFQGVWWLQAFGVMKELYERGDAIDGSIVGAECKRLNPGYPVDKIITAIARTPSTSAVKKYAELVAENAEWRRLTMGFEDARSVVAKREVPLGDAKERIAALSASIALTRGTPPRDRNFQEMLAGFDDSYNWIVPDVLEHGDRVIVVAAEGFGKSMFLRQFGVCVSQGIHPFTFEYQDPSPVLYIDLENPDRMVVRTTRKMWDQAHKYTRCWDPDRFVVIPRPRGLDILKRADQRWLEDRLLANKPRLLVIGPLYKLYSGNINEEEKARAVVAVLDDLRTRYGLTLLMEHHAPKATGGVRDINPFGSSVWLRWPEFGISLKPAPEAQGGDGMAVLGHYRGPRDKRDWPYWLRKGGAFPFTAEREV